MSLKRRVLKLMEQNRDEFISGEVLAKNFDVSRTAINKAINGLRDEGYLIESVTNKGYRLKRNNDILSVEGILPYLSKGYKGKLFVYDTLESTNKTAKEIAVGDCISGSCVIANSQTKGRGRLNRDFYSPKDSGVYMSYILKPEVDADIYNVVTVAACIAVCRAIYKLTGKKAGIKWVNDILLNGKKVCGILTEGVYDLENGRISLVVIGIGINVSTDDFPEDIQTIAGSLTDDKKDFVLRNRLIGEVINELEELTMPESLKGREFINEYRENSLVIGKDVELSVWDKKFKVHVLDIDDNGGLVVRHEDNSIESLNYGEVSLRWSDLNE